MAHEHKCILLKIQGSRGFPDRLLLTPNGAILFVEFKKPGEHLRPLQAHIHSELHRMRFQCVTVTSVQQFKQYLLDLLHQSGTHMVTKNAVSNG